MAERRVAWVFGATACLWGGRRLLVEHLGLPLNDTSIAMAAGVALFLIPSREVTQRTLLTWDQAQRLPWDILLLFGGGLTLAAQLAEVGVLDMVAEGLASIPSLSTGLLVGVEFGFEVQTCQIHYPEDKTEENKHKKAVFIVTSRQVQRNTYTQT